MKARIVLKKKTTNKTKSLIENYIKTAAEQVNLIYKKEDSVIEVIGTGHKDDYGKITLLLIHLIQKDWFMKCAEICQYVYGDYYEDALSQSDMIRGKLSKYDRKTTIA